MLRFLNHKQSGWIMFARDLVTILMEVSLRYQKKMRCFFAEWHVRVGSFGIPTTFLVQGTEKAARLLPSLKLTASVYLKMVVSNRNLRNSRGLFSGANC